MDRALEEQLDRAIAAATPGERAGLVVSLAAKLAALGAGLAVAPGEPTSADRNIGIDEAARRLGMSARWVYRNAKRFPFTRREGRRLLFSERGLEAHLAKRTR